MPLIHKESSDLPEEEKLRRLSILSKIKPDHFYKIAEIVKEGWFSRNTLMEWIKNGRDICYIHGRPVTVYLQADRLPHAWLIPGANLILFLQLISEYHRGKDTINLNDFVRRVEKYNSTKSL